MVEGQETVEHLLGGPVERSSGPVLTQSVTAAIVAAADARARAMRTRGSSGRGGGRRITVRASEGGCVGFVTLTLPKGS